VPARKRFFHYPQLADAILVGNSKPVLSRVLSERSRNNDKLSVGRVRRVPYRRQFDCAGAGVSEDGATGKRRLAGS
tara:strand:+ start:415 stop:642 length:228 start_codon:yes stop_codon:yes gene_type:complete